MAFSPLASMGSRIPDGGRSTPRSSAVTGMGLHHNAGVDSYGEASNPRREVSANYWIANDGTIIPNVDEARRAFTSGASGYPAGAAADHRNVTVEISNSPEGVRSGSWAISDAAYSSLCALIADVWARHGLGPVKRGAQRGLGVHQDWVPTACPGPYIMANLAQIIDEANRINSGGKAPAIKLGDDDMAKPMIAMKLDGGSMNTLGVMIDPDGAVTALDGGQWDFWLKVAKVEPIVCTNPGHWEYLMWTQAERRKRSGVVVSEADLRRIAEAVSVSVGGVGVKATAAEVAAVLQVTVKGG